MPLLIVMFFISYIDRQNLAFAKLEMVRDLGTTETAYGLGASLFFVGYLFLEIPSALALHRFGARRWLARIMITWGVITVLMAFAKTLPVFYALRFALGAAEAGFSPGVFYYLTRWFPRPYLTRVVGFFLLGSTLANMLTSLIGGALLAMHRFLGLSGWQWIFIVTGIPAILVALVALRFLPDAIEDATFLSGAERILARDARDRDANPTAKRNQPWQALRDPRVLFLGATYVLMATASYGVTYWMPTLLDSTGLSYSRNGLLNMIPWGCATLFLLWLPGRLQREHTVLKAMTLIAGIGALGFASSFLLPTFALRFAALCVGGACIPLLYPCFWSLPPKFFAGARGAASFAAINAIGSLGRFGGQNLMPYVGKVSHSHVAPMLVPMGCLLVLALGSAIAWRASRATGPSDGAPR